MSDLDDPSNPFGDANGAYQLIVQMRIYDVLMAILNNMDEKTADMVYEAHQNGRIVSGLPTFIPQPQGEDNGSDG